MPEKPSQFEGGDFLKDKYWNKPEFREATADSARRTEIRESEKIPDKPQDRIENYLGRFTEITDREDPAKRERGIEAIRRLVERKYVVKPENISDDYIRNVLLGNQAELLGYQREDLNNEEIRKTVLAALESRIHSPLDSYSIPEQTRKKLETMVITDQERRMNDWLTYLLTGEESRHAPAALRYWAFAEMLKQGDYDPLRKEYNKRTEGTVAVFPELDQQALALVFDKVARKRAGQPSALSFEDDAQKAELSELLKNENFGKLYAFMQEHVRSLKLPTERLIITDGEWRQFPQGSRPEELTAPLQGFQTKWCIAGEGHASSYLDMSDVWIYFSQDAEGENTIPRACIVNNQEQGITEVRGIIFNDEAKQHLDDYITPVVDKKLEEMNGGEKWADKMTDMKKLRELHFKHLRKEPLAKEDLTFLYEVDRSIQSSGYGRDPRIAELLKDRDIKEDIKTLYNHDLNNPDKLALEFIYDAGARPIPSVFLKKMEELRQGRNLGDDMLVVFECTKEQIAYNAEEINENTKAYIGEWNPKIHQTIKQFPNIKHLYESFPKDKIFMYKLETDPDINSPEKAEKAIKAKNIYLSDWGTDIIYKTEFSQEGKTYELVRFTVEQLGFPHGATTAEIIGTKNDVDENGNPAPFTSGAMTEFGLGLCPAEVGPHLRLKYPGKERFFIAMKQITDRGDDADVFYLTWGGAQLEPYGDYAGPEVRWHSGDGFVFLSRKLDTQKL